MIRNILTFKLIKPMLQIRTIMNSSSIIIARAVIPITNPADPYVFGSTRLLAELLLLLAAPATVDLSPSSPTTYPRATAATTRAGREPI